MEEIKEKIREKIIRLKYFNKEKLQQLISYLIFDRNCTWLHLLISTLATFEMESQLIGDEEFKHKYIDAADIKWISGEGIDKPDEHTPSWEIIPKNTMYCEGCEYYGNSNIANALLGSQCDGYCYYLGKGDFSFVRSTDLLWDMCKCCGRYEFEGDDE